ncbi:E3 ubiquitin-protein ligase RNF220 isoform X2 [Vanessa atalanta]|uniref:E3 ubiquitin-protein ligase RNF220 isoform X2 n=1 Tax=Vanessa atalanta TaxID=42275 RepID=UPI001FCDA54F|nr:E3 ubiquitin-protein ligase RNF220 isoform X2 [Vanessa atalanta]
MLPVVMYNMEGSSNTIPNSNFGSVFDDNVILNCVRSRKKVTELPNCPVCSCTIRQGELDTHLCLEVERLNKLSNGGSKRKLSANSPGSSNPMPGSSSSVDNQSDVDVSGCLGSDVYQRVHTNRLKRLRARRRSPPPQQGECPVCNATLPVSRLQRHALRCLKRTGAEMDEDIPDTSSEDGSIDVENDEPSGFGAEYQWCGEWRVRAAALQGSEARPATCVRRASTDRALVVDGDEDTELYGPAQYSPSRIAPDADIPVEDKDTSFERKDKRFGKKAEFILRSEVSYLPRTVYIPGCFDPMLARVLRGLLAPIAACQENLSSMQRNHDSRSPQKNLYVKCYRMILAQLYYNNNIKNIFLSAP